LGGDWGGGGSPAAAGTSRRAQSEGRRRRGWGRRGPARAQDVAPVAPPRLARQAYTSPVCVARRCPPPPVWQPCRASRSGATEANFRVTTADATK